MSHQEEMKMKKTITVILVLLACALLTACGCEHEWTEADCASPKTCALCGEAEGAPLGHSWLAATCTAPKTCEVCGETQGEELEHAWTDASCVEPKTCESCGLTEGEALGHVFAEYVDCENPPACGVCGENSGEVREHEWLDATTEDPKTCSLCGKTEGEPINVDSRFVTANCRDIFGTWTGTATNSAEELGVEGVDADITYTATMIFRADGTAQQTTLLEKESYIAAMTDWTVEYMYALYAGYGMTEADADAAMKAAYGMDVREYVQASFAELSEEDLTSVIDWVYYVEDGQLYLAESWDAEFAPARIAVEGDSLTMEDELVSIVFTRVE